MYHPRWAIGLAMVLIATARIAAQDVMDAASQQPPNLVLIVVDDMGCTDAGVLGSDFYQTPAIDRLAAGGMLFTQAYANAANCAPSRAAIMSGQYPPRTGVLTVGSPDRGPAERRALLTPPSRRELPSSVVTIAEALKSAGYATAHVGKWHLGDDPEHGPRGQGFDLNVGGNRRGHPASYHSPYGNPDLPDGPEGEHLTARLTDEAIAFVAGSAHRPFFLHLSYYAVHTPLQPPADLKEKYRHTRRGERHQSVRYAAMVEGVDRQIGRLLTALHEQGLDERTVVMLTSDNGGLGQVTTMSPWRGSKGMFYEGGIRVPLIVRWPGQVSAASRCDTPVIGCDLYPTLLELAGAALPEGHTLDGLSLVPLLTGGNALSREAIFWHFPAYLEAGPALGVGPWRTTPCSAVRAGRFKLLEFFEDERLELYDLEDDPGERTDLSASEPERARALQSRLAAWRETIGAVVPREPNPAYDALAQDGGEDPRDRPPNIIFILADDLGYGELGCYGQRKIQTPNIDRLAAEGMRLSRHYAGSPVCAPSRCTLLTGLHTGHAFIRNNREMGGWERGAREGQLALPQGTVTLPGLLQDLGYATCVVGKWGLGGPDSTGHPNRQGFDHFYGHLCQRLAHNHYPEHLWRNAERDVLANGYFSAHQRLETPPDGPGGFDVYQGEQYVGDLIAEEALRFIAEHRDRPFFLFYASPVPHVAIQVPQDSMEPYVGRWEETPYLGQKGYLPHPTPRAGYAAMISRLDRDVGRIMSRLTELGLDNDTLVIFSSDNGPTYNGGSDSAFFESVGPLRGLKGSVFEGGIRVPAITRWPGRIPAGVVSDQISAFWDWLPTLLELAGDKAPPDVDGVSRAATLLGHREERSIREALYWELGRQQAVLAGDWKLVRRTDKEGRTTTMLFDLADDPAEERDLAEEQPAELERMLPLARKLREPSPEFPSPYDDGR